MMIIRNRRKILKQLNYTMKIIGYIYISLYGVSTFLIEQTDRILDSWKLILNRK